MSVRIPVSDFAALAMKEYGTVILGRVQIKSLGAKYDVQPPSAIWKNRVGRGLFSVPGVAASDQASSYKAGSTKVAVAKSKKVFKPAPAVPAEADEATTKLIQNDSFNGVPVYSAPRDHSYVPDADPDFVAWGNYSTVLKLMSGSNFMSMYLTGETGNGKTMNYEQAAAKLRQELIVVNFTAATDEDDLIGGFRLINGNTVWVDGPVVEAMRRGANLLLDEIDLGAEAVMCLQSVVQGKSYYIKKLSRLIKPAPGFKVFATGNTKGDGAGGNYIWTNPLNTAFLDRFKVTLTQEYPNEATEKKILDKFAANHELTVDASLTANLCQFATANRQAYSEGGISDQISTRRLVDILQLSDTLGSVRLAIELATNRFNEENQSALLTLWDNIVTPPAVDAAVDPAEPNISEKLRTALHGPAF